MMTRVAGVEQKDRIHPVKVAAVAPGVIDTGMQTLIRTKNEDEFPPVSRFHQLKAEEKLWSPDHAAALLVHYLESDAFGSEPIFDIRSWQIS